ncbi:MAG: class A beta-lactamase [Candidatus Velthaea sp.]
MLDRRSFLSLLAAAPVTPALEHIFAAADRLAHGGLGIAVFDRLTGRRWELRGQRRFHMASVFKLPLAALVWEMVDRGQLERGSAILVEPSDIRPGPGSTEARTAVPPLVLAGRALRESDNTAADLLLKAVGGPKRLTAWLERRGFDIRVDSSEEMFAREPLVRPHAGDERDTASPVAMVQFLDQLVAGSLVGPEATASIMAEMESSPTGRRRLRAGVPGSWISGDKTGTNGFATNDVAFFVPEGRRSAICMAAFIEEPPGAKLDAEAALAAAARSLAANL